MVERRWITIRQAAEYLSMNRQTIYALLYQNKIPGGRVGRSWRVDKLKLDKELEKNSH
jgi:excisionase family DNA binding protein